MHVILRNSCSVVSTGQSLRILLTRRAHLHLQLVYSDSNNHLAEIFTSNPNTVVMDGTVITSLATIHLSNKSRLLATAWCPDKDLLVLVSRHAHADRMSLWKMQGSKIWEVDVVLDLGDGYQDMITALSWGPDGQSFACF